MNSDSESQQVEAFMRRFKITIAIFAALVILPLAFYALYLDWRLDSFQDRLRFRPPQSSNGTVQTAVDQFPVDAVQGQTVYVPAYSHVYHHDGKPHLLTVTLSIRNTDLAKAITVTSVRYYDTNGKQVRSHLDKPLKLAPLATTEFLVERDDPSGGSGANFLVQWVANTPVTSPVIETVMIDTGSQQGISFARAGTVIKEKLPEENPPTDTPSEANPTPESP